MAAGTTTSIEPLGARHDRTAFSCGNAALDTYLKKTARQDQRRNVSQTFVALGRESTEILGYYSLSALSIDLGDLPAVIARRLPKYPAVPAALIGRLAVSGRHQGRGLGALLLANAIARVLRAKHELAVFAIVVDAIDGNASRFYDHHGFVALPSAPHRLFLPTATAVAGNDDHSS